MISTDAVSKGLQVPHNQYYGGSRESLDMRLMEYKPPGPPIWTG